MRAASAGDRERSRNESGDTIVDASFISRIESSFSLIAPRAQELVDRFYASLFAQHPAVRGMFPTDMKEQKSKLLASLVLVVKSLRNPDALTPVLLEMGRRHAGYGTQPEHYPVVRDTMLDAMAHVGGSDWTPQMQQDWSAALDTVAEIMLEGQLATSAPAV